MIVDRPQLKWYEKIYLPTIVAGMAITLKHLKKSFLANIGMRTEPKLHPSLEMSKRGTFTMQYPEEKWPMPDGYRGAPTLVKDEDNREKCVSCQLCEFVCPPRAIRITPGFTQDERHANVEKAPKEFEIDMIRCIYCGLCEEVCPEEAIFLLKEYAITGSSRAEMVHDKEKLYDMGGVLPLPIKKWKNK
ncbi:MAG: NADH-quinone oxidoreductase subunit I [Verrucomicrobiota bacterium]|nr:NADH-quinone oxidoreductase subunit I [Verrucomicrobiota bacterium]